MGWAVTWLCVALGLASGSVEAASNAPMPLILLPFLSSALRADRLHADRAGLDRGAPALHPDHRHPPRLPRGARSGLRRLVGDRLVRPDHRALLLVGRSALRAGSGSLILMLTISQLASYAGVTVRAVRHYHQIGLLPEPARDGSGYRTYDAADVVRLIRIRTLAEAGVPLARVQELLDADAGGVQRGGRPDRRRAARQDPRAAGAPPADRPARRRGLTRAAARGGRRTSTSCAPAASSEAMVEGERDGWILMAARWPEKIPEFMVDKMAQLDDPRTVQLYRLIGELVEVGIDEDRLQRRGRPAGRDARRSRPSAVSWTDRTRR